MKLHVGDRVRYERRVLTIDQVLPPWEHVAGVGADEQGKGHMVWAEDAELIEEGKGDGKDAAR